MRIEGLDGVVRNLNEIQQALEDLDGRVSDLSFDPHDPESIERAIQQLYSAVDEKLADYAHNETVMGIADEIKEAGRSAIVERAATARLADEEDS